MTGEVVAFDEHAGLGSVRESESAAEYPFHCTAIVGGSRSIGIGMAVAFDVVPGGLGRWEATRLVPLARD